MNRLQTYLSFVRFSHSVFALPFALTGALLALHERSSGRPGTWPGACVLDRRRHGGGAQRGDGIQPARGRAVRREESADGHARAAARGDVRREAIVFVVVSSVAFIGASSQLGRVCLLLSPVALAIVFWYSLAKRFTSYTQLFLALAMAVAPVGGWLAAGGPIGALEPWLLGAAIGAWVGGFDILYACQDLEFDRAAGLKSIPVRFGVRDSLLMSRLMHAVAVACLAGLAAVADLGPMYLAGVALVAVLLVYEQSLVSEHDLSQVKRAFDLNGYVGILYFVATAASLYVK